MDCLASVTSNLLPGDEFLRLAMRLTNLPDNYLVI